MLIQVLSYLLKLKVFYQAMFFMLLIQVQLKKDPIFIYYNIFYKVPSFLNQAIYFNLKTNYQITLIVIKLFLIHWLSH